MYDISMPFIKTVFNEGDFISSFAIIVNRDKPIHQTPIIH
jgi:hypothetical protein